MPFSKGAKHTANFFSFWRHFFLVGSKCSSCVLPFTRVKGREQVSDSQVRCQGCGLGEQPCESCAHFGRSNSRTCCTEGVCRACAPPVVVPNVRAGMDVSQRHASSMPRLAAGLLFVMGACRSRASKLASKAGEQLCFASLADALLGPGGSRPRWPETTATSPPRYRRHWSPALWSSSF